MNGSHLQYVAWASNSSLIIVKNNDLYYQPSVESSTVHRITSTGVEGVLFNGVPDWIYEEELLNSGSASWVSPGGTFLAFCTFNDTRVRTHHINSFYSMDQSTVRYPLAGDINPGVNLTLVKLGVDGVGPYWFLSPPRELEKMDWYISSVSWANDDTLSVSWLPRSQQFMVYTLCSPPDYTCTMVAGELGNQQTQPGWIEPHGSPLFHSNMSRYKGN
ncbi:dipeptidyl aminopeptidase-like protein 6 [Eurytemora carolleeae]|uniref:dipeptidyl aminopeptidase-like protein 6 n=1 Tax=Eurytemora carolleeae TaxID=1294199 RepID=UPI000C77C7AD|nr:dipeptidyl aminopeptidase-like protein 6 [Eurytemora carolleeae]|eukprot:XP_023327805.1 dipeptidyl aminopeptidase-like protein 6 [Eurytemora affinis]